MGSQPLSILLHLVYIHMDRSYVPYYKSCYNKLLLTQVLTQTQKEPAVSADQKTNAKTGLDKVDGQGTGNTEALERIRLASHQYQTLSEDLANANNHMLDLTSAVLTALRKCCIVWLH